MAIANRRRHCASRLLIQNDYTVVALEARERTKLLVGIQLIDRALTSDHWLQKILAMNFSTRRPKICQCGSV